MNTNGWVMHKIKFSELNQYRLAEQTPPGHTHFMAPFTDRSIDAFEQAVIIKKKPLMRGNEENEKIKYPHGVLEYDRTIRAKKIPKFITYYNNDGVGVLRQVIEHDNVEYADVALKPGGKRKSRKTKKSKKTKKTKKTKKSRKTKKS
jgi:hypothetical protein